MPVTFQGIRNNSSGIGVAQGGTGKNSLDSGSLLVGNGGNPVGLIAPGSEGQVLTVVNGEWAAANNAGGGGGGGLSSISTSGNLQGNGTAGSPATLKANISLTSVTASFSGNGAALTNLTASQIGGLNGAIDARITNIPNAALQNSSITVNGESVSLGGSVTIATASAGISAVSSSGNIQGDGTGADPLILVDDITINSVTAVTGTVSGDLTVQGNLYVNGSQTFVNTTDLTITDNIILIASGAANSAQLDGAGIHFGRLPSEDARIIYDSVNDWMEIYPGISSSLYTGNGAGLVNIPNSALQNSSITINGSAVSLGGSATISDPSILTFTGSGFVVGNAVAMSGSYVKADYSDSLKSNVVGVVSAVDGTSVTIKLFGEVTATSASLVSAVGTPMYLGPSGSVVQYSSIPSGKFATQVGFITPNSGKIILQPRVFGQLA